MWGQRLSNKGVLLGRSSEIVKGLWLVGFVTGWFSSPATVRVSSGLAV
jgi:hypothetical protein